MSVFGQSVPYSSAIPATIPATDFTVELVDVIRLPNSGGGLAPRMDLLLPAPTGDGRLVANDQRGAIYGFTPGDTRAELLFDASTLPGFAQTITAGNSFGFELGVRSFAFHPDFARPGTQGYRRAYVMYSTYDGSGPSVFPSPPGFGTAHYSALAEFIVDPDTLVFNPNSRRDILKVAQFGNNHNVGQIAFMPGTEPGDDEHGLLYLGSGDGGGGNDPADAGQRTDSLLGKMLRIDPLRPSAVRNGPTYSVPDDNPFVDDPNIPDEIWATGLRAPTRIAWDDPALGGDGRMFFNDIGQGSIEEINVGRPGANYGWDIREGSFLNDANGQIFRLPGDHPTDEFTYPVAQYDHDFDNDGIREGGVASIGGFVVRDPNLPQLDGHYVFGDFADQADGPIFVVPVDDLIERDDLTDVYGLSGGLLAPFENLRLTRGGVEIDSFEALVRQAAGNPSLNRSDLRFGTDDVGGLYVLNKRDSWVRKLMAAPREASDFDFSGASDAEDVDRLLAAFGAVGPNTEIFELDDTGGSDNVIDAADLGVWLALVGSTLGDANLNGTVEQADLDAVLTGWGQAGRGWAGGDLDGSGTVEQADLDLVLTNWGSAAAPSFAGFDVPEPGALALLGLSGVFCLRRRGASVTMRG